ncbi:hypothetical protein ACJJTC_018951 [Scirpophaga incertulas]
MDGLLIYNSRRIRLTIGAYSSTIIKLAPMDNMRKRDQKDPGLVSVELIYLLRELHLQILCIQYYILKRRKENLPEKIQQPYLIEDLCIQYYILKRRKENLPEKIQQLHLQILCIQYYILKRRKENLPEKIQQPYLIEENSLKRK